MRAPAAIALLAVACGPPPPALTRPLRAPAALTDLNPDPKIVEVKLVAAASTAEYLPGKTAEVWAYRDGATEDPGTVPGPALLANAGDQVIVHFENRLAVSTTVHWHGLRLPNAMDGSTVTQSSIDPGATYDYRFTARDPGTFWFHPHVRGDEQIERGLYAPFIVRGPKDAELDVAADRTLVLDDVKLLADGALDPTTDALDVMLGRQGNVLLVNGQRGAELAVARGSRERWRFVNAANGRFFNLALPGHRFRVIGWDGGLVPEPYDVETLLVAPGERYEVLVELNGESAPLQTLHYDRGHDVPDPGPRDLLQVVYGPALERPPRALPASWGERPALPVEANTFERPFVLEELENANGVTFYINGKFWPLNDTVMVKQNDLEIWRVRNTAEMDHPFHLHGFFFQVLDVDGAPPAHAGWKDTVNVPKNATLRFAVRYDAAGMWMFHCHILEHAERGMMGDLMVMP